MAECSFTVKERVVYPGQGVGEIVEITEKKFKDELLTYYVIYFEESDMTVLVPAQKSQELGIRTIVSAEEAETALSFLSEKYDPIPTDWKMRYQMNLDLFKTGSILDNASIVRSLYHRSKIKELPIQERKLYDSAYRIFHDELSYALQKTKSEIEAMIHSYLEVLSKNVPIGKQETMNDEMYGADMGDMEEEEFDDDE
ncbi:MAG: CarD family transcriptional regulator [Treponema sp.]|uniref:CarD family transcriptional regulator n=1 Tax=Treponema sp. TaxID=166 RepID=UPI003FA22B16